MMHDKTEASNGWRPRIVAMGRGRAMLALTVFSVFASEVLTVASMYAMHMEPAAIKIALVLAALVPAIVAPMAAYLLTQLMFEIEQAHAQLKIVASRLPNRPAALRCAGAIRRQSLGVRHR